MSGRVLIADLSPQIHAALRAFLEGHELRVMGVHAFDEALTEVREAEPDVLFTSCDAGFDGEALCREVKKIAPRVGVVLIYPPEVDPADSQVRKAGADAALAAPLKRANVISCARLLLRARAAEEHARRLESGQGPRPAEPIEETGTSPDFELLKKLMLLELKRSTRYRYPLSFVLLGLDRLPESLRGRAPEEQKQMLAHALELLAGGIRAVDLTVPFEQGRFLLFMPHTGRDGAMMAAVRSKERLSELKESHGITASVGVASFEPGPSAPQVSFGGLMKEANAALRRAQDAGGDRIEWAGKPGPAGRRNRIFLG